jgi:hypothetical protein
MVVVIIRYETTAAARWALLFIVRTFFNDAFTVAVWTSFHTCLMWSRRRIRQAKVMHSASIASVQMPLALGDLMP